jgi:hypothetical protein
MKNLFRILFTLVSAANAADTRCFTVTLFDTFGDGWGSDVALQVKTLHKTENLQLTCPYGAEDLSHVVCTCDPFIQFSIVDLVDRPRETWEVLWKVEPRDDFEASQAAVSAYFGDYHTTMQGTLNSWELHTENPVYVLALEKKNEIITIGPTSPYINTASFSGVTVVSSGTGTGSTGGFNVGPHIRFGGSSNRHFELNAIDTSNTDVIYVTAIRGNGNNGGEDPDETDENLILEYKNDADWTFLLTVIAYSDSSFNSLNTASVTFPEAARAPGTILRFRQTDQSGSCCDHFGITEIRMTAITTSLADEGEEARCTACPKPKPQPKPKPMPSPSQRGDGSGSSQSEDSSSQETSSERDENTDVDSATIVELIIGPTSPYINTASFSGVTVVSSGTGTGTTGGFNVGPHIRFDGSSNRHFELNAIDTSNTDVIYVTAIRGNGNNGGEDPDETDENLILEYKNGTDWVFLLTVIAYSNTSFNSLNTASVTFPEAARAPGTILRFRQTDQSGSCCDHFGITEIRMTAVITPFYCPSHENGTATSTSKPKPKPKPRKLQIQLHYSQEYEHSSYEFSSFEYYSSYDYNSYSNSFYCRSESYSYFSSHYDFSYQDFCSDNAANEYLNLLALGEAGLFNSGEYATFVDMAGSSPVTYQDRWFQSKMELIPTPMYFESGSCSDIVVASEPFALLTYLQTLPATLTTPEYTISTADRVHLLKEGTMCKAGGTEICEEYIPDGDYVFRVTGALRFWDVVGDDERKWSFCGKHGTWMEELEFTIENGVCYSGDKVAAFDACYEHTSCSLSGSMVLRGIKDELNAYDTALLENDLSAILAESSGLPARAMIESWQSTLSGLYITYKLSVSPDVHGQDALSGTFLSDIASAFDAKATTFANNGKFISFLNAGLDNLPLNSEISISKATAVAFSASVAGKCTFVSGSKVLTASTEASASNLASPALVVKSLTDVESTFTILMGLVGSIAVVAFVVSRIRRYDNVQKIEEEEESMESQRRPFAMDTTRRSAEKEVELVQELAPQF